MPSEKLVANVNSLTPEENPVVIITINHPLLSEPIRLVEDNKKLVSQGNTYFAVSLSIDAQDDVVNELPKISLSLSNTSLDLVHWINRSQGLKDAEFIFNVVRRSEPDVHEQEDVKAKVQNVNYSFKSVTVDLVVQDNLNKRGIRWLYIQRRTPGIFL